MLQLAACCLIAFAIVFSMYRCMADAVEPQTSMVASDWDSYDDNEVMQAVATFDKKSEDNSFSDHALLAMMVRYGNDVCKFCEYECAQHPYRAVGPDDLQTHVWEAIQRRSDSFDGKKCAHFLNWARRVAHSVYADIRRRKIVFCALSDEPENHPKNLIQLAGETETESDERWTVASVECLEGLSPKQKEVMRASASFFVFESGSQKIKCFMDKDLERDLAKEWDTKADNVRQTRKRALDNFEACVQQKLAQHGIKAESRRRG